jgi:hypothetical protein
MDFAIDCFDIVYAPMRGSLRDLPHPTALGCRAGYPSIGTSPETLGNIEDHAVRGRAAWAGAVGAGDARAFCSGLLCSGAIGPCGMTYAARLTREPGLEAFCFATIPNRKHHDNDAHRSLRHDPPTDMIERK